MKYQLIVITQHTENPQWRYLQNRFFVDIDATLMLSNDRQMLLPLLELFQSVLKNSMRIVGIAYIGISEQGQAGKPGMAVYSDAASRGQRPTTEEMRYRYVVQINHETLIGRHGKSWIRGAVDRNDINEGEKNRISMKDKTLFDGALAAFMSGANPVLFDSLITRPVEANGSPITGGRKISKLYTMGAVNSHAQTRVRFKIDGEGPTHYASIVEAVAFMVSAFHFIKARFVSDGLFTFADVFMRVTIALQTPKVIHAKIKPYFKDADQDPANQEEPPIIRFGATCADILDAFRVQADSIELELPEMQKIFKPYTDPFDREEYITLSNMEPYLDMLEGVIQSVAFAVDFDGYNLHAYPSQDPQQGTANAPEFVIMAL